LVVPGEPVMAPFARQIFVLVSEPLTAVLPEGSSLIAIGVASPFMTPFIPLALCTL
jgi:sec-independent protein translocase protein TatC